MRGIIHNISEAMVSDVFGKNGTIEVVYDEFHIDFDIPFKLQIENLAEDLVQIKCSKDFLIDIEWYPEFDPEGNIRVVLIKDGNWSHPVLEFEVATLMEVYQAIEDAIAYVFKMLQRD